MHLKEALEIHEKDLIALVGGGGKTTLMFSLANELALAGANVITTTTTKIEEPTLSQTELLLLDLDKDKLLERVDIDLIKYHHITVAKERLASGKLAGVSPDTVTDLMSLKRVDYVVAEADGAARHPVKAPADHEPVIPITATVVIPVVGIDALGQVLEQAVFRFEIAARLLKVSPDAVITPEIIAELVTNQNGIMKGSPKGAKIVPFINKVDIDGGLEKSRQVARAILARDPAIKSVVLGQVGKGRAVVEVVRIN